MKSVWISLINFRNRNETVDCLKSLDKLRKDTFSLNVVVVDNGSREKLVFGENYSFDLKVLESKKNLGFSGGQNMGIKYALENGADYVLILNNDTVVDRNLVFELLKGIDKDSVGIAAPKIYFAPGFEFHKDRYKKEDLGKVIWYAGGLMDWDNVLGHHRGVDEVDKGQYDKTQPTDFASGCCMLIKGEVFDRIGFFNETYFLYYEDNDFSQRAKEKGFAIAYTPQAILWHKNAGSAGVGSDLQDYYITRNRLIFGMKYASLRLKISLVKESLKLLLTGRIWQKKGIVDFWKGNLNQGSYE